MLKTQLHHGHITCDANFDRKSRTPVELPEPLLDIMLPKATLMSLPNGISFYQMISQQTYPQTEHTTATSIAMFYISKTFRCQLNSICSSHEIKQNIKQDQKNNCNCALKRTSWNNDIGMRAGRLNVVVVCWLDKVSVLLKHTIKITAPLTDVTLQSTSKSDVRVRVNKHFHIHYLHTCTINHQ